MAINQLEIGINNNNKFILIIFIISSIKYNSLAAAAFFFLPDFNLTQISAFLLTVPFNELIDI